MKDTVLEKVYIKFYNINICFNAYIETFVQRHDSINTFLKLIHQITFALKFLLSIIYFACTLLISVLLPIIYIKLYTVKNIFKHVSQNNPFRSFSNAKESLERLQGLHWNQMSFALNYFVLTNISCTIHGEKLESP